MSTKQQRKTMARKTKQREAAARAALERVALRCVGGPRDAERATEMSTEKLLQVIKRGRRRTDALPLLGTDLALEALEYLSAENRRMIAQLPIVSA